MTCRTITTKIENVCAGDVLDQGAHADKRVMRRQKVRRDLHVLHFTDGSRGKFYSGVSWRVRRCAKKGRKI